VIFVTSKATPYMRLPTRSGRAGLNDDGKLVFPVGSRQLLDRVVLLPSSLSRPYVANDATQRTLPLMRSSWSGSPAAGAAAPAT
jgi:hypothetical protein